jgi:hypothetical protein
MLSCFTKGQNEILPKKSTLFIGCVFTVWHVSTWETSTGIMATHQEHFNTVTHYTRVKVFSPMPPHVHISICPGCGRSVTDFWGWGAHRAQLRCPDDVSDDDMYECGVPGGALNLKFYKLPRPWSLWGSSPAKKNSHGRTWNRTRDLMVSSQKLWAPSHEAGRYYNVVVTVFVWCGFPHQTQWCTECSACNCVLPIIESCISSMIDCSIRHM